MSYNSALGQLRSSDIQQAFEAQRYLMQVYRDNTRETYRADVAAYVIRGILDRDGPEWKVLVEEFGEPQQRDWAMAQRAYGPDARYPGL